MKHFGKKIVLCLALATVMASPSAFAILPSFSVAGALQYRLNSNDILGTNYTGALGYGGGLMVDFPVATAMGLDIGAFLLSRGQSTSSGTGSSTTSHTTFLHFPGGLRIHVGPVLSFLVGGFYDTMLDSAPAGT